MKRRNFFALAAASVASFFVSGFKSARNLDGSWEQFFGKLNLQRRRVPTPQICMLDAIRQTDEYKLLLVNDEFFVKLCDELNCTLANHFDSSKDVPITAIKIWYRNILDRQQNPRGDIGFFDVIAERRT